MLSSSIFLALSLGLLASATPVDVKRDSKITLSFAAKVNATGIRNLAAADRARAAAHFHGKHPGNSARDVDMDVDVLNTGVTYTASVGVGSPPTYCG